MYQSGRNFKDGGGQHHSNTHLMSESAWGKASWPPDFLCSIFDAFLDMGRRPTATHSFRAVQRNSGAIRTKARSNFDLGWYCPPVKSADGCRAPAPID